MPSRLEAQKIINRRKSDLSFPYSTVIPFGCGRDDSYWALDHAKRMLNLRPHLRFRVFDLA
jgi:hypothetical protein